MKVIRALYRTSFGSSPYVHFARSFVFTMSFFFNIDIQVKFLILQGEYMDVEHIQILV